MGEQHRGGHVAEDGRLEESGAEIGERAAACEERGAFGGRVRRRARILFGGRGRGSGDRALHHLRTRDRL